MSFKSFLKGLAIVGLGIVTFGGSIAAAAATAGAWLTSGTIGAMVARTVLTIGLSKLIANRAGTKAAGGDAPSARFQLRPSTTNKVPLVYGSGYYGSVMTDAIISTDNKTMWYVMACAEVTDTGTLSFGDIYLDNRLVTFDGTDQTKVVSLTNNAGQVDTNIDGNMYIYKYNNGSSSGVNTAQTAIQILQDGAIPVARRWTSTNTMTDTAFVIIKLNFNADKQVTGLGEVKLNMINTLNKPGEVLLDYMQNTRYGCAIPLSQIDTASLTALDTYSDELITYTPDGGGSATQARYRINGPIDLSTNCLSNLQGIADACDSWIQYSELVGKWKVVINKPYTGTLSSLYSVDSSVLIGGIDITPLDLNQTYNSIEVQFPSSAIKDQTVVRVVDLTDPSTDWYNPSLLSPNEPNNRLTIQYQIVNNYVQAIYLGVRRLLQSREDLTISCNLDYSGIQIEAGDVVRVTLAEYGWTDKLFRVSTVSEIKREDGNLGASIVAFEYNDTIYNDQAIQDYVPADNTGLTDPNVFDKPSTPIVSLAAVANGAINYYSVSSNVPAVGTTLFMDFNIGNSSNVLTHKSYSSVAVGSGTPYGANSTITINVADSSPGTYYWSATARNLQAGRQSDSSNAFVWNGPSVSTYDANTGNGGITTNQINSDVYGVGRIISGINFSIPNFAANTVTVPVAVSSTTLNEPVIIPPVSLNSATDYYPPYQNTALNTNLPGNGFYQANSTGSLSPALSWNFVGNPGEGNWYALLGDQWAANSIKSYENMTASFGIVLVSDGPAKVQLAQGVLQDGLGYFVTDMTKMGTFYFPEADMPQRIELEEIWLTNGANIIGTHVICRNIDDGTTYGANVTLVSGSLSVKASKNPFI